MSDEFDVCGPLPTGLTVLEASAGTGKTFTIEALATRYVAAGYPLHQLLAVSFTRAASSELRERVRERLVTTHRLLMFGPQGDALAELLAGADRDVHIERLAAAIAGFDAATITTTHGFCLEALGSLGVLGDAERELRVTEDADDLLEQVVDDLMVRKWHAAGEAPLFDRAEAMALARTATHNPTAPIEPTTTTVAPHLTRVGFCHAVRRELDARKRRAGVLTYDDLLTRLRGTLESDAACARLRDRYRVVLVDEFQDTDPVQWEIVHRAFADAEALVLIGDPKQAIYAFRGADVFAYLAAAREARQRATLRTSYRSDQPLLDALDHLFGDAQLGHEEIVYRRTRAHVPEHRLHDGGAPLRIRVVERHGVGTTKQGYANANGAREHVAIDVAADIVRLLDSEASTKDGPVRPGDVAVLVRTHRQAEMVHDALRDAGVPVVFNGAGSVFATEAAGHWLALLEALERPTSGPRAHAVALGPFLGWSARQVAEAGEDAWEEVHRRLHAWARVLRERGVASLLEVIVAHERLWPRVLARAEGERAATDLRHLGSLLHATATAERLGVTALTGWLRARVDDAATDGDEELTRRLDSDAAAVQVMTVHRAKGLEFPIVYVPFLWDGRWTPDKAEPVVFHDPRAGDVRTIDVALDGRAFQTHQHQAEVEERGEDLRLAYVALTRARHQVVVWWAGTWYGKSAPLSRLLFARRQDGSIATECAAVPEDADAMTRLRELERQAGGCLDVAWATPAPGTYARPSSSGAELRCATFDRPLDRTWRRTSYSGIVALAHETVVATEPEGTRPPDEVPDDALPTVPEDAASASPLAGLPGGRRFGSFVHEVLERADFAADDLGAVIADLHGRWPLDIGSPADLAAGLRLALSTPVGTQALRGTARGDRLDELTFELPLAGGDRPAGRVLLSALAEVLERHTSEDDPLHAYADRLRSEELEGELRGFLTGSIDLVWRVDGRFVVVDYKTNRLSSYGPAVLRATMLDAHYALQGLLYLVALHRYLRWRLAGYDPAVHLGGIAYLFLRGMTGEPDAGVFGWRPPDGLVEALSDALDAAPVATR